MAVRCLKDGRWICYYRGPDGKQKDEYFGRGPTAEAAAWRRNAELGLGKRKKAAGLLFKDLSKAYFKSKTFNDNSRKQLSIRLASTILPFFGNCVAMNLKDQDMDDFVQKLHNNGLKYSSITRYLNDVKAIMNWAAGRNPKMIAYNPVRDYKKPGEIDQEEIDPPTPAEVEKIIKNASPHVARALKLAWFLGMRPGSVEMFSLTWRRVNWDKRTVRVIGAVKGGPQSRKQKTRHVPIHDLFYDELRAWWRQDNRSGPIIHFHGKAIKSMKTAWKNTLESAKIKRRLRPYDLRHNFITQALEEGADIKALSEVVGSSPETIRKFYQHVTREMHRQTVAVRPNLKTPVPDKIPRRKKRTKKK